MKFPLLETTILLKSTESNKIASLDEYNFFYQLLYL